MTLTEIWELAMTGVILGRWAPAGNTGNKSAKLWRELGLLVYTFPSLSQDIRFLTILVITTHVRSNAAATG